MNNKYDAAIVLAEATQRPVEGDNFVVLPSIGSTMDVIDEAISARKPNNYMAIALEQTKGRGSTDVVTGSPRKWSSGKGNAMFSQIVVLRPGEYGQEIELVAALANRETISGFLRGLGIKAESKFPNDVLVRGKKIAGHYVPPAYNEPSGGKVNLGIGTNIRLTPPDQIATGTCLHDHGAWNVGIGMYLRTFSIQFNHQLQLYRAMGFNYVLKRLGYQNDGEKSIHAQIIESGKQITGAYGGFVAKGDHVYMRLREPGRPEHEIHLRNMRILTKGPQANYD